MFERSSLPYVINQKIELQISVADPDLFAGFGSGNFTTKSESGSSSGSLKKYPFLCNIVHMYIYSVYVIHRLG
jgi:hypothetical protein